MLLRIWPWMLLLVVANLLLLVFIAGLAGWLVFPALLVCCVVDLLALYIFCTSVKENFDLENGNAEESKKAFEEENWSFIYLSALSSLWVSSRLEICRDRRDRRSCKIFVSCVNFSRKQRSFLNILQVYTHLNINFLNKC